MRKEKNVQWAWVALFILYFLIGLLLLPRYQYILQPDAISYLAVSRKILAGDWLAAVNGYWGPLLSWVFIPFLLLIHHSFTPGQVANLLLGGLLLLGIKKLADRFYLSPGHKFILVFLFLPIDYYFVYSPLTSDLLVVLLLVFYFYLIFSPAYTVSPAFGPLCGLLGALIYLAKSYHFLYFPCHFTLMHLLHALIHRPEPERRHLLRQYIKGMAVFILVSSFWIANLSDKYEKLTFSTTPHRAWTLVRPGSSGTGISEEGLFLPPDPMATSIWEDPSYLPYLRWSPFALKENFTHVMHTIQSNLRETVTTFNRHSPVYLIIFLLFTVILLANFWRREEKRLWLLLPFFSFLTYPIGFMPIYLNERYLWVNFILFWLMTGYIFSCIHAKLFRGRWIVNLVFIFVLISFLLTPIKYSRHDYDRLGEKWLSGRKIYEVAQKVKKAAPPRANTASNAFWGESLILAYYMGGRYFGRTRE